MKKYLIPVMSLLVLNSCGKTLNTDLGNDSTSNNSDSLPFVVKSRGVLAIQTGGQSSNAASTSSSSGYSNLDTAIDANVPITVTNSPSSSMTIDTTSFIIPTISNAVLDFGSLQLKTLLDNNLKVCGTNGKQKCTKAIIRAYTIGTAVAGIYNSTDGYSVPISAGQTTLSEIGLNVAGAITLQSFTIPNNRNTVKITDFTNPKYNVQADFSDAGTGSYQTTLVIEYGLQ